MFLVANVFLYGVWVLYFGLVLVCCLRSVLAAEGFRQRERALHEMRQVSKSRADQLQLDEQEVRLCSAASSTSDLG